MASELRRAFWEADRLFGLLDRAFPWVIALGVVLLFADWRWALFVLVVCVPALWWWKGNRALRLAEELGLAKYEGDL